jgi:hypothetical protein
MNPTIIPYPKYLTKPWGAWHSALCRWCAWVSPNGAVGNGQLNVNGTAMDSLMAMQWWWSNTTMMDGSSATWQRWIAWWQYNCNGCWDGNVMAMNAWRQQQWVHNGNGNGWLGDGQLSNGWLGNWRHEHLAMNGLMAMQHQRSNLTGMDNLTATAMNGPFMDGAVMNGAMAWQ